MLTVGDKLPAFTVPVQQGTNALPAGETISDTSYEGKWKVVGYSELKGDFEDRDAVLIGASTDTAHVHLAWRKSDPDLAAADFPWIADNGRVLADALGIVDKNEHVAYRATFIIDPDNVIQHVTINGLNVGRNPAETLRVLDALQTDELCPCNWNKGDDVLQLAAE